jgi:hypothetical protein
MMKKTAKLARFDQKITQKIDLEEQKNKTALYGGFTDQNTIDFVKNRYFVLRDFIPKEILTMTMDTWKVIERNPEQHKLYFQLEDDIIHDSPKPTLQKSHGSYCFPPAVALHHWMRNALRDVLDLRLKETYSYTRKYERGAYLKAHTDRPSCEVSTTICLDYRTDDNTPWKIWGNGTQNWIKRKQFQEDIWNEVQNIPHRERLKNGSVQLALEPGDVLVYQGPNMCHWRDYLLGDYSYHMFLHFHNSSGQIREMDDACYDMKWEEYTGVNHRRYGNAYGKMGINGEARAALDFDGRRNRYDTTADKDGAMEKKMFEKFSDSYDTYHPEELAKHVNAYDWDEAKK